MIYFLKYFHVNVIYDIDYLVCYYIKKVFYSFLQKYLQYVYKNLSNIWINIIAYSNIRGSKIWF